MSPGSSTESYPTFAHIGLRENPGKNLNQVTCPDRESNPGHLVSRLDVLTVTPQVSIRPTFGYLKERVFLTHPTTLLQLKDAISQEIANIPRHYLLNAVHGVAERKLLLAMSRKTTEELLEESTDSETEIENDDDGEVVSEPEDQCIMCDKVDGDEVESSSEDDPDNLSEIEISDKYITSTGRVYVSKPPRISRRAAQNIVKEREGLRNEDSKSRYVISMEPYAGKNKNAAQQTNSATAVVKRLVHPINNSGRNVTTDRQIGNTFLKNSKKFLEENYIPVNLLSVILILEVFQLQLFHIPREKPKRNLLMLSIQHYDDAIGAPSDPKKKTVINLYYNDTKDGVDTVDQMVRKYSTKRATRRWPVSIFYTLLDIAALNGYTTFILNFPDWNKKKPNQRRLHLQELGLKLITPYIEERARNVTGLQKCVISAMEGILKRKIKQTSEAKEVHGGKGRCHLCTRDCRSKIEKYNKVSKTTIICSVCKRYTCGKHSKKTVVCSICEDGCEESDV
ncbi:hypothetical protein ANN_23539 [Periplaneta americana]|uniref:PiggyBac transposable element-derived protein domain-containing protein n=1 Tax=Periplaneta americana TaxID=6978 RepID=A0ABQ8SLE7_PERAM|nr:hypothetical protein ANN_23539 [Periplaneta americana]